MPRLGYSKSRTGCRKCRQRRVKCDEKRPCTACKRHDVPCSLVTDAETPCSDTSPARSVQRSQTPSLPSPPSTESSARLSGDSVVPLVTSPPTAVADVTSPSDQEREWVADMELMHHYCTTAYNTLPRAATIGRTWQIEAVNVALHDAYLLHIIMAFSAFHLAHLYPARRNRYSYAAARHQNLGICGLRAALARLSEHNCHSLFLTSTLLVAVAFAAMTMHASDPLDERPNLADLIEIYILLKGMKTLLSTWEPTIRGGPFHALFELPNNKINTSDVPTLPFWDETLGRLERLRQPLAERVSLLPNDTAACIDREIVHLADLARYCVSMSSDPVIRFVIMWPVETSDQFVQMLKDKEPASLVVLAHYCVVVQKATSRNWFTRGWAPKLLRAIRSSVPPHYADLLSWPLAYIREEAVQGSPLALDTV
ncbi:c6 zinc finger domain-containing protein [Ophiostoma piceae UAMH 11346]|uniref:C6 zinc finger domain-containing protein n=1 Tax=Ophiostoma piceae (strain UAMH 11346) TaxID=1262450 RepID=S3CBM4_OPHP1|nr:c6 zinc finger domain-containing protein [Ophiostoma piceae UAMH 11346]